MRRPLAIALLDGSEILLDWQWTDIASTTRAVYTGADYESSTLVVARHGEGQLVVYFADCPLGGESTKGKGVVLHDDSGLAAAVNRVADVGEFSEDSRDELARALRAKGIL